MKNNTSLHFLHILPFVLLSLPLILCGCRKQSYKLLFDDTGFEATKTEYSVGETVTVYYHSIEAGKHYCFYVDDVEIDQSFDEMHGYVLAFAMPKHNARLTVKTEDIVYYVFGPTISFINEIETADLWILPNTADNRNTMMWGATTGSQLEPGITFLFRLEDPKDADTWILRMIDSKQFYYEFNDIKIDDGCDLRLYADDACFDTVYLEVTENDAKDPIIYTGFRAKL